MEAPVSRLAHVDVRKRVPLCTSWAVHITYPLVTTIHPPATVIFTPLRYAPCQWSGTYAFESRSGGLSHRYRRGCYRL